LACDKRSGKIIADTRRNSWLLSALRECPLYEDAGTRLTVSIDDRVVSQPGGADIDEIYNLPFLYCLVDVDYE
jgi:hypothetical protein